MIASQDAQQALDLTYFYMEYDELGRATEMGLITSANPITSIDPKDEIQWEAWLNAGTKTEISSTHWDASLDPTTSAYFGPGGQQNLRKRIASLTFQKVDGGPIASATHFSYDIHGFIKSMIQEIPALDIYGQSLKRIDYEYDLITGNVHEIKYQQGFKDQFFHRYAYDADNRIEAIYTSRDGVVWDKDAEYEFYDHGPISRVGLGEQNVQGLDYAYTIQGWLKGVNSSVLDPSKDIGKDGSIDGNGLNPENAIDAFGYHLGYFYGDYQEIRGNTQTFTGNQAGAFNSSFQNFDLFNGNIRQVVTSIREMGQAKLPVQSSIYTYDQLSRLTGMDVYQQQDIEVSNVWASGTTPIDDYQTRILYSPNGNIQELDRNGKLDPVAGSTLEMDQLKYLYYPNSNKVHKITDNATSSSYTNDLATGQQDFNYVYDADGKLTQDLQEGITKIEWNSINKVSRVEKDDNSVLEFVYDAMGNRIAKKSYVSGKPDGETTWYVRDDADRVMAIYTESITAGQNTLSLAEMPIYGREVVGMMSVNEELAAGEVIPPLPSNGQHKFGQKHYQLNDHPRKRQGGYH